IAGTILRRASRGELPLAEGFQKARSGAITSAAEGTPLAAETASLANLKRAALLLAGLGAQKYAGRVEEEQEFLLAVGDLAILAFAWESALLRARALQQRSRPEAMVAAELARLVGEWTLEQAETTARRALAGMERGDALEGHLSLVGRLFKRPPLDTVALGRRVARRVLAAGGYTLAATE
ncbi:MAG: acyl-CoA dehydrogenase, partial [Chloroflexota bacterium]|nr:acyl-CoA dehydrogenase [Chloroflexota bacterium]